MKKRLPLVLSAKTATFRAQDANAESADAEFRAIRPKILDRDGDTCQFCGFRDKGAYIQVHHRDDDHGNNRADNLVTACIHCHAVHHIGLWGAWGEATLIYMPEVEQHELSDICRALLVAQHYPGRLASVAPGDVAALDAARRMQNSAEVVWEKLRAREEGAIDLIGTSNPRVLANVLANLPPALYEERAARLAGIRLLIGKIHRGGKAGDGADRFETIAREWMDRTNQRSGPFHALQPREWAGLVSRSAPAHA